ncbi:MAG: ABC transporter permease [Oscillospiraceae bacterium]
MKMLTFSSRVAKEILRDPLNLAFGLGFPIVLLLLMTAIQANIPVEIFALESLTPGIAVFGLSFMTLFSATIVAKDRSGSLLLRLYTTPLSAADFIAGYTIPLLPIAVLQCAVCYLVAVLLGLDFTANIIWAVLLIIPAAVFFIALGLLCGSVLTDKQVGGICGALVTNLSAWLSGAWFDLDLVGGVFKKIAYALPFVRANEIGKAALSGNFGDIFPNMFWVLGYAAVTAVLAVLLFLRQMDRQ